MSNKVICAKCTFAEGIPGSICGWCSATIVAWNAPSESEFILYEIEGWIDHRGSCYCEYRGARQKFCRAPSFKEKTETGSLATEAYFLCEEHWNLLTHEGKVPYQYSRMIIATDQADPLRIYTHSRHGEIYVFNHGSGDWFASLKSWWSGTGGRRAEMTSEATDALMGLIQKLDSGVIHP